MENQSNLPSHMSNHLDAIDFNSDGGLFLSASSLTNRTWCGSVWYFDKADCAPDVEKRSAGVESDGGVSDLAWLPGSERVICGTDDGLVMLWELTDGRSSFTCAAPLMGHHNVVSTVSHSSDSTKIFSGSHDRQVKIWDLEEFVCIASYQGHFDVVHHVEGHPNNPNILVSAAQDSRLILWDLRESKPASMIDTKFIPSMPRSAAWQPGKDHGIVVGTETGELVIQDTRWSVGTPSMLKVHNRPVTRLKFAPHKPEWLASVSEDCKVKVTDISSEKLVYQDNSHNDMVRGVAWDPKTHNLYTCGWDTKVVNRAVNESEHLSLEAMDIKEKTSPPKKESPMETHSPVPKCNGIAT